MRKNVERIGETKNNTQGFEMTIVAYRNSKSIDIQFEDGTLVSDRGYGEFIKGFIQHPLHSRKKVERIGKSALMGHGSLCTIVDYRNAHDLDVMFEDGSVLCGRTYQEFKNGTIMHPNLKGTCVYGLDSRVGESKIMRNGEKCFIIAYRSATDIDVQFDDGTKVCRRSYFHFQHGSIKNPNNTRRTVSKVGETKTMNNGLNCTIIKHNSSSDIDVMFENGDIVHHKTYNSFQRGAISSPSFYKQLREGETGLASNLQMMTIIRYHNSENIDVQFDDGTVIEGVTYGHFRSGKILNPNCRISGVSFPELVIAYYLSSFGFRKVNGKELAKLGFTGFGKLELDLFGIVNNKPFAIEYDGIAIGHTWQADKRKNQLCHANQIQLIRVRSSMVEKYVDKHIVFFYLSSADRFSQEFQTIINAIGDVIGINCNADFERDYMAIEKYTKIFRSNAYMWRTGETSVNRQGQRMTIIKYRNSNDIDIMFDDGTHVKHTTYDKFQRGTISCTAIQSQ